MGTTDQFQADAKPNEEFSLLAVLRGENKGVEIVVCSICPFTNSQKLKIRKVTLFPLCGSIVLNGILKFSLSTVRHRWILVHPGESKTNKQLNSKECEIPEIIRVR